WSSSPSGLTTVNGTLLFSADGACGRELWKSDGTVAGTTLVKDIFPGRSSGGWYYSSYIYNSSSPGNLTSANGTLFFAADDGSHGTELWALPSATVGIASLAVSGFPAATAAGTAGSFAVTATNADGTTATGYTGTVHLGSTDPHAV